MNDTTPSWPVHSIAETQRILTAPGAPFEMEEVTVRGVRVRSYTNMLKNLREVFDTAREYGRDPGREYVIYEDERQTYRDHFAAAGLLGRILADRYGVAKGDRVAIAMRNLPEWSLAFWAAASIGAVITPLNAWGMGEDLAYGITNSGARVAFVDGERLERIAPLVGTLDLSALIATRAPDRFGTDAVAIEELIGAPESYSAIIDDPAPDPGIDTDEPATILYTSGTTGRPKGALGTHRNLLSNIVSIGYNPYRAAIRRGDPMPQPDPVPPQKVTLIPVPLFHVTGINSLMVPAVIGGAKLVLMHRWNPERFLELVERERVTGTSQVPAMVWQVLESPDLTTRDLSSLEGWGFGGAAVAPELTQRFARLFPWFAPGQGYGATETSSVSASNAAEDFLTHPDSVGVAVPVCDVKAVDLDGNDLPPGAVGELWIRGPNVVAGYYGNPDATAKAFTDGWYHTGDVGRIDADGFIYVMDRVKDMLIRGGENIYCVEIEDVLVAHPAVIDAAVVGLPHRMWGEEVGAVVQLRAGMEASADELIGHAARLLSPFKVPVRIDVRREEFPRNASGKTLKPVLREQLVALHGQGR